jgi:hypothetical protein
MTDDMMNLRSLLEKSSDAELLREMVGFAAQRLMELEVEGLTGAGHGERDPNRGPVFFTRGSGREYQRGARGNYFPTRLAAYLILSSSARSTAAGSTRPYALAAIAELSS